jgi:glycosyltransferase involved in cell wall biosynthesis/GT2 family glycosyltransferase
MRICLVSREYAPFHGAGIGTYVSQMARAYSLAGHEVHVVTEPHPHLHVDGPRLRPGVTHHAVDLDSGVASMDGFAAGAMKHAMGVHELLSRLQGAHGFDYIEFPDYGGEGHFALAARRTGGAYAGAVMAIRLHTPVQDCLELNAETWLDRERAYSIAIESAAIREADVLFSPCRSLLERVRSRLTGGAAGKPGQVIHYPFDLTALSEELGDAAPESSDVPTVLYFGRLERRKGVHLLIEAGQRLLDEGRRVRFRLIGGDTHSGPMGTRMRRHLRRLIRPEHSSSFVFEASRPRLELGSAIKGATCCCFPSLWENFPNVCLEAMSLGALVVGSDAGGMSEMIEHGESGLLMKSGSVDDLAEQLRRALDDAPLRARVEREAPARIAAICDPASIVRQMEAAIDGTRRSLTPRTSDNGHATAPRRVGAPRVSVVIPFFDMAGWLPATIESLDRQTSRDFETILVDDGSTDADSIAIVERLERERSDIRVIRRHNRGLAAARNAGIEAARGEWVLPLDADDLLAPTYIERTLDAAHRCEADRPALVTTLVGVFQEYPPTRIWVSLGLERDLLGVLNVCSPCTALIRRSALEEVGGYDQWLTSYEDWDLYCTLAERGFSSVVVPEPLFLYRQREGSMRREVGEPREHRYRTYIQAKHPGLASDVSFSMRFLAGELRHAETVYIENPRYQIVDRLNSALKKTPIHGALKQMAVRVMGIGRT